MPEHHDAQGTPTAWSLLPTDEVRALAQGCTELTCIYHGRFNEELRRRARLEARNA